MESLPIIAEVGIGARAITPSKLSRGGTPIKLRASSAEKQRALSASRLQRTATAHVTPQLKRHASARRVRRWENANMFGLEGHINQYLEDSDEENGPNQRSAFSAETKSSFESMFASKDEDLIERFRRGEENVLLHHTNTQLPPHLRPNLTLIEKGLLHVEKRIRSVLFEKIATSETLLELMLQTEQLLFAFVQNNSITLEEHIVRTKPFWNRWLTQDISQNQKCELELQFKSNFDCISSSFSCIPSVMNSQKRKQLKKSEKQTAFLRLLIHAVCQFHHVTSHSILLPKHDKRSNSSSNKFIRIVKPKYVSQTLENRVSLANHLYLGIEGNFTDLFASTESAATETESVVHCVEKGGKVVREHSLSPSLEKSYQEAMNTLEDEEFVVVDEGEVVQNGREEEVQRADDESNEKKEMM